MRAVFRRLWLAILGLSILSVLLPAGAAAVEVRFSTTAKADAVELLISAKTPLGFSQDRIGDALILTFDRAIQGSLQSVRPTLPDFVDDLRIEDDGETLILILKSDGQAQVKRANSNIVVNLSAKGQTPVVGDTRAAAVNDSAAAADDGAPTAALIPIRVGRHPDYERVVFDWPQTVQFELTVDQGKARLTFDQDGRFDRSGLRQNLPAPLTLVDVPAAASNREFLFEIPPGMQPKAFQAGTKIVLDFPVRDVPNTLLPALTDNARTPEASLNAKTSEKTAAKENLVAAPKTQATLPASDIGAAVAADAPGDGAAKEAGGSLEKSPASNAPPGAENQQDAAQTADADQTAPPERVAVAIQMMAGGAAAEVGKTGDSVADQGLGEVSIGEVIEDPDAFKKSMFNILPERLITGPVLPVTSSLKDELLSIRFEWTTLTAAAVFTRAGYLWAVFDKQVRFDFSKFNIPDNLRIGRLQQIPVVDGSAFRVELVPGANPRVWRDGLAWVVELQPQEMQPQVPLSFNTQMAAASGPRLFVPIESTGETVMLIDPMVGDNILIVPLAQLGRGVTQKRQYAEFTILESAQGIIISPKLDGIKITSLPDGLTIEHKNGLMLSAPPDPKNQELAPNLDGLPPGLSPGRIFAMQRWQRGDQDSFMDNKQELQGAVADATSIARNGPRLALSQFYFGHGLAAETNGLLSIISENDQQLTSRMDVRAMRGAAALMMGRIKTALKALEHPSLDGYSEAELWRGAANASAGLWTEAAENFTRGGEIPGDYPRSFATDLAMLAAETFIRSGDYQAAGKFLYVISRRNPSSAESARLTYLRSKVLFTAGDKAAAVSLWRAGAAGKDRWAQVRSERDLVKFELSEGDISNIEALDRLERLRFTWRGDEVEFGLLEELGDIYLREDNYVNGLGALKQAVKNFPQNASTPAVTKRMTDAFQQIFLDGAAAAMTPLNALSLYDQFRELTPVGDAGDEIIESLVDRLVEVDLLDRASLLLQRQIQFRLQGPDKARVGARLGVIRLLDRQPAAAIKALDESVSPGLSVDLARERNRLRSRAIFELGDIENALALIRRDASRDADLLRADIMWQTQKWAAVTPVFERLIGDRGIDGRRIDERTAVLVLNWTIAAFLSQDEKAIATAKKRFSRAMETTPYREAFILLTSDNRDNPANILSLTKRYDEIGRVQSFLTSYRDKLKVGPLSAATN